MSEQNFIIDGINNIVNRRLEIVFKDMCKKDSNLEYKKLVKDYCKKISKGINIAGFALAAGEGIYKGTKRALGPGGTQFHTSTGVPLWEDRNTDNIGSKLNY